MHLTQMMENLSAFRIRTKHRCHIHKYSVDLIKSNRMFVTGYEFVKKLYVPKIEQFYSLF